MSTLSKNIEVWSTAIAVLASVLKKLSVDKSRYYWHLNPTSEDESEGMQKLHLLA